MKYAMPNKMTLTKPSQRKGSPVFKVTKGKTRKTNGHKEQWSN